MKNPNLQYVHCNLCGRDEVEPMYPNTLNGDESKANWLPYACTSSNYGLHHTIVRCKYCGLVYANPRLHHRQILKSYQSVQDPLYEKEKNGRIRTFEHHLEALEAIIGPAQGRRLLDIGAYTGVFVQVARTRGWAAEGLEPSSWAAEIAKSNNIPVQHGLLESTDFPASTYDVATMWDVIEHLVDPAKALQQTFDVLKPGGYAVVHTMDIESRFARVMGERWPWLMQMHIIFFSKHTLHKMLEKTGFQVLDIRPEGRFLRLGYLMGRLRAFSPIIGAPAEKIAHVLRLTETPIPVNFGDLITAYAQKPASISKNA